MAGILSFTLGLETSNFLRGLGLASGQILSLSAVADAAGRAMQGVWSAIERGGALNDLSARTGESVGNLYRLEEAFKVVGIGAESVSPMLLRLQKAMGGADENGNKTGEVFKRLGLDAERLSQLQAPEQIERIATALSRVDRGDAVDIAGRLFGREGAGNFMQLTRDLGGYRQTLRESAEAAQIFARSAGAFDAIGDTISLIRMKVGGLFAGLAESIAPALQRVLDWVNGIDWVGIGQDIGRYIRAGMNALTDGSVGRLLELSLQVAFEKGTFYGQQFAVSVGAALMEAIPPALSAAWKLGLTAIRNVNLATAETRLAAAEKSYELAQNPTGGERGIYSAGRIESARMELERAQAGFDAVYAETVAAGEGVKQEVLGDIRTAVANGLKAFGGSWTAPETEAQRNLNELIARLAGAMDSGQAGAAGSGRRVAMGQIKAGDGGLSSVSEWEKLGWVVGGGGGAVNDAARETANHTRIMIKEQQKTNRLLEKGDGAGSFANR
jgi:hypothetical protein